MHNLLVDEVRAADTPSPDVFAEAQRLTRWHYQWLILHEYLSLTVGDQLVQEVLREESRVYRPGERPYVPVEFSAAAFRFGHAQVRSLTDVNDAVRGVPIFPDLVGQRPVPAALRPDWRWFFDVPGGPAPQPTQRVDVAYTGALMHLPVQLTGELEQGERKVRWSGRRRP
ncbi:MAG: peroxidase family protein [Longimicrobiales bacterium]